MRLLQPECKLSWFLSSRKPFSLIFVPPTQLYACETTAQTFSEWANSASSASWNTCMWWFGHSVEGGQASRTIAGLAGYSGAHITAQAPCLPQSSILDMVAAGLGKGTKTP